MSFFPSAQAIKPRSFKAFFNVTPFLIRFIKIFPSLRGLTGVKGEIKEGYQGFNFSSQEALKPFSL
jgi:hypothetical protein